MPFRLTICGIAELKAQSGAAVSHVLSILDPEHPVPEAFAVFGPHMRLELRFNDIIDEQPDQVAPTAEHVDELLAFGRDIIRPFARPHHLLVHCHAGVSRSTACAVLLLAQALPHWSADAVLDAVYELRHAIWPNLRLLELGDAALGRNGALVEAAGRLYARQMEHNLDLIPYFTSLGRQRELAAGFAAGALAEDGLA